MTAAGKANLFVCLFARLSIHLSAYLSASMSVSLKHHSCGVVIGEGGAGVGSMHHYGTDLHERCPHLLAEITAQLGTAMFFYTSVVTYN